MGTKQSELILIFMLTLDPGGPCYNPGFSFPVAGWWQGPGYAGGWDRLIKLGI